MAENNIAKVVVIGASGRTGRNTVQQLAKANIAVKAVGRSQEKLAEFNNVETVVLDLEHSQEADYTKALEGSNIVICATRAGAMNPNMYEVEVEGVKKLVDTAKKLDTSYFFILVSSISTEHTEQILFLTAVLREKRKSELYIIESGLPYLVVRPGGLLDEPGGQPILVSRGDKIRGRINREDVARVLVAACQRRETAKKQVIEIVNSAEGKQPTDQDFFAV